MKGREESRERVMEGRWEGDGLGTIKEGRME